MPRLTHCPESGISLDGISCKKRALTLWPQLDPNNLPDTLAGQRYKLLMTEHAARMQDDEDRRVRARNATKS